MKIWITRHGETNLNRAHLMQGRTDEPLNENGLRQAEEARKKIGNIKFDAVYSSPLQRAIITASIIGDVHEDSILQDERLIEADFGRYEKKLYTDMGLKMSLYWAFPEIFRAPESVETTDSLKKRSTSFLEEIEKTDYENVLITCHGGIMRALSGYLGDKKNGLMWRPKPRNCEIRIFEYKNGMHRYLRDIR